MPQKAELLSCVARTKVVAQGKNGGSFCCRVALREIPEQLSPYSVQTYFQRATRFALLTGEPGEAKVNTYSWAGMKTSQPVNADRRVSRETLKVNLDRRRT